MSTLLLTSSGKFILNNELPFTKPLQQMKIGYVNTASKVIADDSYSLEKQQKMREGNYQYEIIDIAGKSEAELRNFFKNKDVIYVEGGNTFYLLKCVRESGFDKIVKDLLKQNVIYIGSSAGSVVAGPDIYPTYMLDRAEQAPNLKGYQGLGLTDILVFPHWGTERFRERYLPQRMEHAFTPNHKIVLLTDSQYLKIQDQNINFVQI